MEKASNTKPALISIIQPDTIMFRQLSEAKQFAECHGCAKQYINRIAWGQGKGGELCGGGRSRINTLQ